MGQKVNPIGFRLGINRTWDSRWYADGNYADGDAVAEALYKRGLALDRLGEPDLARQAFELVVQNYPEDNMANLAQQFLDRLGQ